MPGLSGSALKAIALLSMTADHTACYLMDEGSMAYEAVRCVGRIAFPVFALLVAEGFSHTRNRWRYLLSLLLFAVISEVPWYLLNGVDGTHNVLFTLALGTACLALFEGLCEHRILCCLSILLLAGLAEWLGTDYGWRGVLMIILFYLFRRTDKGICGFQHSTMLQLMFTFPLMLHYGMVGAMLACMVILLYDGTRGFVHGNIAKYIFYAFYPVHLLLLYTFTS